MSDSDRSQLSFIEETGSYGVTPAGNLQIMRFTHDSLKQDMSSVESAEIRSDRQIVDVIRTSIGASGDVGLEFSYSANEKLIEAAVMSAGFSAAVTVGPIATISVANGDNSFNDSANGLAGLLVNQWVKTSGFTNASNNGYFKVLTSAAGKITVSGGTLTTEIAAAGHKITMGPQIVNGTTGRSFSLERKYADLANTFAAYVGMMINNLSLKIQADQILSGALGWMGQSETSKAATIGTGYTAAPSNSVLAAVDHINAILEAQAKIDIISMDMALANDLRNRMVVGKLGPVSIGKGKCKVTGNMKVYFETAAMIDKYLNNQTTSLTIIAKDSAGNAYILDLPTVKFTAGQRPTPGQNADIVADLTFVAFRNSSEDITLRWAKFDSSM